jgi:hypothetical protein
MSDISGLLFVQIMLVVILSAAVVFAALWLYYKAKAKKVEVMHKRWATATDKDELTECGNKLSPGSATLVDAHVTCKRCLKIMDGKK